MAHKFPSFPLTPPTKRFVSPHRDAGVSYRPTHTLSDSCSRTLQHSRCSLSRGSNSDVPYEGHSLITLPPCCGLTAPAASTSHPQVLRVASGWRNSVKLDPGELTAFAVFKVKIPQSNYSDTTFFPHLHMSGLIWLPGSLKISFGWTNKDCLFEAFNTDPFLLHKLSFISKILIIKVELFHWTKYWITECCRFLTFPLQLQNAKRLCMCSLIH